MAVGGRLSGKIPQFFGAGLKVRAADRIRYPDGFVSILPVRMKATVIHDPVVMFEVLGDEAAANDVLVKNRDCSLTSSVQSYVMLMQDGIAGMMFERVEGDWIGRLSSANSGLHMPEIGLDVPVMEFHAGFDFPMERGVTSGQSP